MSDGQIWDIVARWQGLRPLQHLYLDPVIHARFKDSAVVTGPDNDPLRVEMVDILKLARNEKEIGHNSSEPCSKRTFSTSETGRFYKALTGYWVATEGLKLAQHCRCILQSIEFKTFNQVTALWEQRTDMQESLDVLEAFDFFGFLCQHIDSMDLDSFTDWFGVR